MHDIRCCLQGQDVSQPSIETLLSQRFSCTHVNQEQQESLWSAVKYAEVIRNPGEQTKCMEVDVGVFELLVAGM